MMRSCRVSKDTRSDEKEKVETLGVSDPTQGPDGVRPWRMVARRHGVEERIIDTPQRYDHGSVDSREDG
jgi:hypothetical protein